MVVVSRWSGVVEDVHCFEWWNPPPIRVVARLKKGVEKHFLTLPGLKHGRTLRGGVAWVGGFQTGRRYKVSG